MHNIRNNSTPYCYLNQINSQPTIINLQKKISSKFFFSFRKKAYLVSATTKIECVLTHNQIKPFRVLNKLQNPSPGNLFQDGLTNMPPSNWALDRCLLNKMVNPALF